MPNRRPEIAMTPAEVGDFVAAGRVLTLVTIGPDGLPDPVPMWYVVGPDGAPLMRTFTKSQKVVNLRRDPRCAALVDDGDRYLALRGVQLTGRVELFDDVEAMLDVATGLAVKYEGMDPADVPAAREAARPVAAKWTGLRLVAERIASWDHRKLA